MRKQLWWAVLWLWAFALVPVLSASPATPLQVFSPGPGTLALDEGWLFRPGDDLRWADPDFQDGSWRPLRADAPWGSQGFAGYTGYGWYRLHFELKNPGAAPQIFFPAVDDNYEVFLNGESLGRVGGFPPHARIANAALGTILPLRGLNRSGPNLLAVRVWKSQLASSDLPEVGGFEAAPVLGDAAGLQLMRNEALAIHDRSFLVREMLSAVIFAAGAVCLVLFLRGTTGPVSLWVAIYLLADATSALLSTLFWYRFTLGALQLMNALRVTACNIALWMVLLHLFGLTQRAAWRRATLWLSVLLLLTQAIDTTTLFFWQFAHPALPWIDGVTTLVYTLLPAYLFAILYAGLRRGSRINVWPLALSVCCYGLYNFVIDATLQGQRFTGLRFSGAVDTWTMSLAGYPVGLRSCLDAVFVLALLLTVGRQQATERARQTALEVEFKSAQEIQRVLIPDTLPETPGFVVDALYRPAEEVGGDFFQLIPTGQEGLLLVIGDVSGKGLKAAMMVSLIVGAIRTLAEVSDSPGAMLSGLNRRLVGRTAGGFATCLALHLDRDGRARLANAGHLPPFLQHKEMELQGTLPLGVLEDQEFAESMFRLPSGEQLTFYTDGLLEARRPDGELFGFERIAAVLAQKPSLAELMGNAVRFGQEDDITLMTVSRT